MAVSRILGLFPNSSSSAHNFAGLSRSAIISLTLICFATGSGLLANGFLARLLGVENYGIYSFSIAVLGLVSVPYASGLAQAVLRYIASYRTRKYFGLMRGLNAWSIRWVLGSAIAIAAVSALVVWEIQDRMVNDLVLAQWVVFGILPMAAVLTLSGATLQGLGRIFMGQIPNLLIRPLLLLVFVIILFFAIGDRDIAAWQALLALAVAIGAAATVSLFMARRSVGAVTKRAPPEFAVRQWAYAIMPFLAIGGLTQINAQVDLLMLGWMGTMEDVGLYRPAALLAALTLFGQAAINVHLRPAVASLHAVGDSVGLQESVTASARLSLLFSLPLAVLLSVFGYWALLFLFGEHYTAAWGVIGILCLGKVTNTILGPVVVTLNMTGNEIFTLRGMLVAAVINLALCFMLIPLWGIYGAAVATCISEMTWSALLALGVYRRLSVNPTVVFSR